MQYLHPAIYCIVPFFKHLFVGCNTVIRRTSRRGVDFLYHYCLRQTSGLRHLNGIQIFLSIHGQILRHGFFKQPEVITCIPFRISRKMFNDDHPLVLSNCTQDMFCFYFFSAPETGLNGTSITIFGETVKWVPISPGRVTNIIHAEINMRV